jgi:hypothetical protein
MMDGSDAVSDWPLLNALVNTASGATWVSIHHGGGVGMGFSQHAGVVIVADGTPEAAKRLERVLWNDPASGVWRHADAGYQAAADCARDNGLRLSVRRAFFANFGPWPTTQLKLKNSHRPEDQSAHPTLTKGFRRGCAESHCGTVPGVVDLSATKLMDPTRVPLTYPNTLASVTDAPVATDMAADSAMARAATPSGKVTGIAVPWTTALTKAAHSAA